MKNIIFVLVFVLIQSCASKKEEPSFAHRIFGLFEDFSKTVTEEHLKTSPSERPVLPKAYHVAVYFKKPEGKAKSPQEWKWTQEDKDQIMSAIKSKKTKIGKVFELLELGAEKMDAKSLRIMASQQGADALLIVQGVSQVESDPNGMALTYLVIVPAFFVNGNHVDGSFVTQAVLWDVQDPYVHMGVQNEGDYSHNRPLVFRQIPRVIEKSKEESLNGLTAKLQKEFAQI
jgi:hypothetical protein